MDAPGFQVAAAIGQGRLMERYTALFGEQGMVVGQVLLTKDLLANRTQYLNARGRPGADARPQSGPDHQ